MLHVAFVLTLQTQLNKHIAVTNEREQTHGKRVDHDRRSGGKCKKEGCPDKCGQSDDEMLATLTQDVVRVEMCRMAMVSNTFRTNEWSRNMT